MMEISLSCLGKECAFRILGAFRTGHVSRAVPLALQSDKTRGLSTGVSSNLRYATDQISISEEFICTVQSPSRAENERIVYLLKESCCFSLFEIVFYCSAQDRGKDFLIIK
ncbi:hypothetical protein SUGI_0068010 [Cryptomeria japonica]|nr:hypothetical protein SUGI_0068010 [Cryptomeria japonica]